MALLTVSARMRRTACILIGALAAHAAAGAAVDPATRTFVARDGIVSIKAEHFTDNVGAWEEVEGRNATEQRRGLSHDHRLVIRDAGHALAAGLSGNVTLRRGATIPWGMPGAAATVVAVAGHDPGKAVVFAYERGTPLPGGGLAQGPRIVTTAPLAGLEPFRRLFSAAAVWAAEANDGRKMALLLLNEEERVEDDQAIEAQLRAEGFVVTLQLAANVEPGDTTGKIVVVPGSVRVEKLDARLREITSPIVLAHKTDVALELGLTLPPQLVAGAPNAMLIRTGTWTDHLRYAIHFTEPGDYHVWLLGQSGGTGGSDEVKVFFEEEPNPRSDRFFEMRFDVKPGWTNRAFARRPDNRKTPVPAVIRIDRAGWHTLYLVKGSEPEHHTPEPPPEYRYPNWRVDKIVVLRPGLPPPTGDGPAETRNDGSIHVPGERLRSAEFLPPEVWTVRERFVVIEAEALTHDPQWVPTKDPAGFSGACFLEWRGPGLTRSVEGLFGNNDYRHVRQGAPEWSLVIRVLVDEPGVYRLDVRNHHRRKDGDNDCWISVWGARATPEEPIVRLGDSHRDGAGFTWLDWGVPTFEFKRGLNEVRIGGRSVGFGVDRIALYREGDARAKDRALDVATPAARPGYRFAAVRDFELMAPAGARVPYYYDIRGADPARHAVAIDASQHRAKFAAARMVFGGTSGRYDITLATLTENDGESTYRVRLGDRLLGEFQNPARTDNTSASHTWQGVELRVGDVITIESNAHSNGRIPEADGFAWARGRWTHLQLIPAGEDARGAQP